MKALVKMSRGDGNVELRDVSVPEPGLGQVRIKVMAAGICGSDLHVYHDTIKFHMKTPVIMGHEFCGIIDKLGPDVEDWKEGERVTCETTVFSCGKCLQCHLGNDNMCRERRVLGFFYDGCFAEYIVVYAARLHRLPENIDFVTGATCEPLACCVHGLTEIIDIKPSNLVLIAGPGTIGLMALQVAKAQGAYAIVAGTTADAERMEIAKKLRADETLFVEEGNVGDRVAELTGGEGVDIFVECSGHPAAARMGLDLVRRKGTYLQMGIFDEPFEVDFAQIVYKELNVAGSLGQKWSAWERAVAMLGQGLLNPTPIITHRLGLDEWKKGFELFESKKGVKIVFLPSGS